MKLTTETMASFSRASYNIIHPDKDLHKSKDTYQKMLAKVREEVGDTFGFEDALNLCYMGFFVTNIGLDSNESMHEFNGNIYYEDGANLTTGGLVDKPYDWMLSGWRIKASPDMVNFEKLHEMHKGSKGYTLTGSSYEECIIKQ